MNYLELLVDASKQLKYYKFNSAKLKSWINRKPINSNDYSQKKKNS